MHASGNGQIILQSIPGTFALKFKVRRCAHLAKNNTIVLNNNANIMLSITTPGLFFPAISLMMLAHTNRFLALAQLIRSLHDKYNNDQGSPHIVMQIKNLRMRMKLLRAMQMFAILSFILCAVCMFCIIQNWGMVANIIFATSIGSFIVSLILSLLEIILSLNALELELSDMEDLSMKKSG